MAIRTLDTKESNLFFKLVWEKGYDIDQERGFVLWYLRSTKAFNNIIQLLGKP